MGELENEAEDLPGPPAGKGGTGRQRRPVGVHSLLASVLSTPLK